ncbi:MAG TPA: hypothetical protein PK864_10755 [Syntrophorhabdaceae bacterium]|nr:hypothetical protein [Syntrophorhabdaceae bacterium]HRR72738.1 hypothetical protein [Syntrophorhabdaceae bacterium]
MLEWIKKTFKKTVDSTPSINSKKPKNRTLNPADIEEIIEERRQTVIISCVGQRGLAVISPIYTLISSFDLDPEDISITLFVSDETEKTGEDCREWLEDIFSGIRVNVLPFSTENLGHIIKALTDYAETVCFHANPGMRWEIANIAMHLPLETNCVYSDFKDLYIWKMNEDTINARSTEILDIGLETYNRFNRINFFEYEGINNGLNENLKMLLYECGFDSHFLAYGNDISRDEDIALFIKNRLVWVREKHGYIYLLFDFQKTADREKDNSNAYYLDMYRAVTKIFDPLNFNLTIITNDYYIKERAAIDGVGFYFVSKRHESWKSRVMEWLRGEVIFAPKRVIHQKLITDMPEKESFGNKDFEGSSCLFVCLGDNIETTLKAILSHNLKNVILFYDRYSKKIAYFAKRVKDIYEDFEIMLVPTDNRGSGILNTIESLFKNLENIDINITPGTKSQTIALVQGARRINRTDSLYSIDNDIIRNLVNPSYFSEVQSPSIEGLIECNMAPYIGSSEIPDIPVFLLIMKGLAKRKIMSHKSILEITANGSPVFLENRYSYDENYCELTCSLDGKTYSFPTYFLNEKIGGIWWEATVAYTLKKNLTDFILWGAAWHWPDSDPDDDRYFTELDIVFRWENHICVVSCKSGVIIGSKNTTRLAVKSEAEKRFGRFALPFVAIPFDRYKGKDYGGLIEDGVMYLTPSVLIDGNRLAGAIESFINSKRTTA